MAGEQGVSSQAEKKTCVDCRSTWECGRVGNRQWFSVIGVESGYGDN